ncbi:hypothetical protein AT575_03325 [Streptococcus penaeicida]|uniref:Uncharacterized protein n=1 Tax=Streptococcus penaeicida TaxID=1765960 RepID=A0A2N8LCP2_9STRE|nr:hypothetical protein [Streptococcus penaeicida]PND47931.1 hypothetical protein AT575_03325 [Streptococcus penaeicida]
MNLKKLKKIETNEHNQLKICKYPKCQKETHSENSIFCGEHSRKVKNIEKIVGGLALTAVTSTGIFKNVSKK